MPSTTVPLPRAHRPGQLPPALLTLPARTALGTAWAVGGAGPVHPPQDPSPRLRGPCTPCSAHTCIYFYSFSHFFRCHLCKYQLSSDTKKLLTLYKYHIYIIYKNTLFSIFV